jgi:hypothetical protein
MPVEDDIKSRTDAELETEFRDERRTHYVPADQPLHPTTDTIENRNAIPDNLRNLLDEMERRGIRPPA